MSETLVWLLCIVGSLLSFALVRFRGWRITGATIAGALLVTAIWAIWYQLTGDDDRPPFFQVHLSLNAFFSLVLAAAGAAVGEFVRQRHGER